MSNTITLEEKIFSILTLTFLKFNNNDLYYDDVIDALIKTITDKTVCYFRRNKETDYFPEFENLETDVILNKIENILKTLEFFDCIKTGSYLGMHLSFIRINKEMLEKFKEKIEKRIPLYTERNKILDIADKFFELYKNSRK